MSDAYKEIVAFLDECDRLDKEATEGWRAGRPDMQSIDCTYNLPYKALYNDEVESQYERGPKSNQPAEAGRVYGDNSIADTQFFAQSRTRLPQAARALRKALRFLDACVCDGADNDFYEECPRCDVLPRIAKILSSK